ENQLENAEEQLRNAAAEVGCLRKQKRLWFERMMKAIRRGLFSVKKLECEEAEKKRACVAAEVQAVVAEESVIIARDSSFEGFNWNSVDLRGSMID
ncbi:hypothetical protein M406DRAFT_264457, partial [Cryphonectria parasitica EP155]